MYVYYYKKQENLHCEAQQAYPHPELEQCGLSLRTSNHMWSSYSQENDFAIFASLTLIFDLSRSKM